jgi:hypothetical protein
MAAVAVVALAFASWFWAARAREMERFRRARGFWKYPTGVAMAAGRDRIVVSLGSDVGIVVGEEFYLARGEPGREPPFGPAGPKPRYLGRARVIAVEFDSAEARLMADAPDGPVRTGDWALIAGPHPPR